MKRSSFATLAWSGLVLAVALAFSLALASCGGDDPVPDDALTGAWTRESSGYSLTYSFANNKDFVYLRSGENSSKGTYVINGENLTMTITDLYINDDTAAQTELPVGWMPADVLIQLLAENDGIGDYTLEEALAFLVNEFTFEIEGNTLTLDEAGLISYLGGGVFTRQ